MLMRVLCFRDHRSDSRHNLHRMLMRVLCFRDHRSDSRHNLPSRANRLFLWLMYPLSPTPSIRENWKSLVDFFNISIGETNCFNFLTVWGITFLTHAFDHIAVVFILPTKCMEPALTL